MTTKISTATFLKDFNNIEQCKYYFSLETNKWDKKICNWSGLVPQGRSVHAVSFKTQPWVQTNITRKKTHRKYVWITTFIVSKRDCVLLSPWFKGTVKKGQVPYCQCLPLRVKMNKYMKLLQTAELVRQRSCCCLLDWCNFNCFENHKVADIFGADIC